MFFSHAAVFLTVFFVMMGAVGLVPAIYESYRDRTQTSLRRTSRELDKFFINLKPTTIIMIVAGIGILLGILVKSWVIAASVGAIALFAPKLTLKVWKDIRSSKFDGQLMDALLLMSASLKGGTDIIAGIEKVATEMKAPISEEFGLVLNSYRLGTPLETALMDVTLRINSRTLETVVYAINIQRESGGNIIKIFDQLVMTIREEAKLQKKVKAMTSQARTQIIFLSAFPWVLGIIFVLAAPDLMQPALHNPWGQITLVFLMVWEMIGIGVTRRISMVQI